MRRTMEIHHDKHHAAYVTNLNKALESAPDLANKSAEEIVANLSAVPEAVRTAVRNNGGGHVNHSFFWILLTPGGSNKPVGKLADAINSTFGSFDEFKEKFAAAAAGRFGSGWAWLVSNGGKLEIGSTPNQDTPLMGKAVAGIEGKPVIGARCLGARLLPQLPEPPPGLREGVLECGELGRGGEELRRRLIASPKASDRTCLRRVRFFLLHVTSSAFALESARPGRARFRALVATLSRRKPGSRPR